MRRTKFSNKTVKRRRPRLRGRCDASIGKSIANCIGGIDVPVKSWGVFIGVLGKSREHAILAQNYFR